MHVFPGSTMYCTPDCDPAFKPCVGKSSQKRARDGTIVWKHMVCNRQGFKNVSKLKTVAPNSESCKNVDLDNQFSGENEEFTT
ncbi:unnamed protein product [Cuscuta epithymum]|uniref:Uncharacterized protein n=1 Tax=Cuscuta epithymum TaxID=186058 RepID=A0AAV0DQ82_9ASTE|nr:unnamed protein product [Cuscuta epithymum]